MAFKFEKCAKSALMETKQLAPERSQLIALFGWAHARILDSLEPCADVIVGILCTAKQ